MWMSPSDALYLLPRDQRTTPAVPHVVEMPDVPPGVVEVLHAVHRVVVYDKPAGLLELRQPDHRQREPVHDLPAREQRVRVVDEHDVERVVRQRRHERHRLGERLKRELDLVREAMLLEILPRHRFPLRVRLERADVLDPAREEDRASAAPELQVAFRKPGCHLLRRLAPMQLWAQDVLLQRDYGAYAEPRVADGETALAPHVPVVARQLIEYAVPHPKSSFRRSVAEPQYGSSL